MYLITLACLRDYRAQIHNDTMPKDYGAVKDVVEEKLTKGSLSDKAEINNTIKWIYHYHSLHKVKEEKTSMFYVKQLQVSI